MPEFSSPMMHGPTGGETEVIRGIRFMIAAELEAVNQYELVREHTDNRFVRAVLRGILEEEKKHIGELFALLHALTPIDASLQADGKEEAMQYRDLDIRSAYQAADLIQPQ